MEYLQLITTDMESVFLLKPPVTTLVAVFNNPNKLTNDLLILKIFENIMFYLLFYKSLHYPEKRKIELESTGCFKAKWER